MQRTEAPRRLTAKYSLLQSAYWMAYCAIYSFAVEFLRAKGFDPAVAGTVLAVSGVTTSLAQPLLAALSERTGRPSPGTIVLGGTALAALLSLLLIFLRGPVSAVVFCALAASMQTLLPFINALGFSYINRGNSLNYGLARALGSALFAGISSVLGLFIVRLGGQTLPFLHIALLALLAAATWVVGEPR